MKYLSIVCGVFFVASAGCKAQTYLECDFSQGIPSDFIVIDNDGLTPSQDMKNIGFEEGTAWIAAAPKNSSNKAACSTSWYQPAGQSDDWLITPPVFIADEHAILKWRAMAYDKNFRDGYSVYVSTTAGETPADFLRDQPLLKVPAEEPEWRLHKVSLDSYKGQTIRIAFVNDSEDKSRLFVDDIFVGVSSTVLLSLDMDTRVATMGPTDVCGMAYTEEEEPIHGFTIGLEYGDSTYTQHFDDLLVAGKPVAFTLDEQLPVGFHEKLPYTVWIADEDSRYALSSHITSYPRKVVCEEGTGTWCGWCVRGIVALDSLRRGCADWAIGIAAHGGDPMANDYVGAIGPYLRSGGYPDGTVNRLVSCDPGKFVPTARNAFLAEKTLVAMSMDVSMATATTVNATTHLWFADDQPEANYRLAFAITENNVHQPDDKGYDQHNYYAGGASGVMGGYEHMSNPVPASMMWYQDVARGFVDEIAGLPGSVPPAIAADEEVAFDVSFPLPEGILDVSNVCIVGMLIDQNDGHIVNALDVPLTKDTACGVDTVVHPSDAYAEYFNIDGARLISPGKGITIVRSKGQTRKVLH
ncbi:MAG: choice-of-anchor J domain-containing protein [Bacteroidaceae bacterium]|nr:choice-of-anchor J domain-containing protein [Bacteroidaceae bacterium]